MSTTQKQFICEDAIYLTKQDRIDILRMVSRSSKNQIKESLDGCRINLDSLSKELIVQIYNLMFHRLDTSKS